MNSCCFEYGTHSPAGNNSSSFHRRLQHYISSSEFSKNLMGDAHVGYRNSFHIFARLLNPLPNCFGNLIGFAKTATNFSFSITHNNNGAETEPASTLDYFRSPVDMNDLFNKLVANCVLIKICQSSPPNCFGIFYRKRIFLTCSQSVNYPEITAA